jgi:hypothetical protein
VSSPTHTALWLAALAFAAGCAGSARAPVRVALAADIGEGVASGPRFFPPPFALAVPEDAVVRIVGPQMTCSGTLVDEDLVLTAHHCVVRRGPRGEFTKELALARDLRIELGGDYLAWGHVVVEAIVAPPCGELGGAGDVAVLVLPRKLVGLGTMSPRLDSPPEIGEALDPVGFGRCAMSEDAIRRRSRAGGRVVGLTSETLEMRASICPGDSGGPVLAQGSREVVGVVSLSAMDGDDRTRNTSVMARVDTYRALFSSARLIADGASPSEIPPLVCAP